MDVLPAINGGDLYGEYCWAPTVEPLVGLQQSLSPVSVSLHRAGLQYRKAAPIRGEANSEVQEIFLTELRGPILSEAQAGLRPVFVMAPFRAGKKPLPSESPGSFCPRTRPI